MKLLKYISAILMGSLLVSLFSACTDDLGIKSELPEEDFTGITLLLPDTEGAAEYGATRGDEHANTRAYDQNRENNFNTLYIVAIDESGNLKKFHKSQPDGTEGIYRKYNISLNPGNYKFYVVSNLNRYIFHEDGSDSNFPEAVNSETDIRNLIINFTSNIPLEPGFLPMACLYENIKVDNNSGEPITDWENKRIEINKGDTKKIFADLDFLCSKVRYTIFFDRGQVSDEFGSADIVDFLGHTSSVATPFVTNLRHSTALRAENPIAEPEKDYIYEGRSDDSKMSTWPLYLDRYQYPTLSEGKNIYTLNPDKEEDAEVLMNAILNLTPASGSWNSGENLNKRVWQGVTYLPENLIKDKVAKENLLTLLNLPYTFNGSLGAENPRKIKMDWEHGDTDKEYGLKRAMSYDVYGLVRTPDPADMKLNVHIKPWTLSQMAYELHGPYELVVETTEIEELGMDEDVVFWFRTDLDPLSIEFLSPQVSSSKVSGQDMVDLFRGKVVTDSKGVPVTDENGAYLYQVGLNPFVPFDVIDKMNHGGLTYTDPKTKEEKVYTGKDISYFHLVAGSLHKRIEIKNLDLDPYLIVDPQTIIIDTRELYTSGEDNPNIPITFETNVDPSASNVTFTLTDVNSLISEGKGYNDATKRYALRISQPTYSHDGNVYTINGADDKVGTLTLNIREIITGNPFWDKNGEYNLVFRLHIERENGQSETIEKPVVIKVRPFSGTYVIHFRDNTKKWGYPHIYVYQDLTLPADMMVVEENGKERPYELAGKIVGFIEENPTSGFQWNAAVQYVFSNNMSFRGWYGSNKASWDEELERYVPEDAVWDESKNLFITTSPDKNRYGGPALNDPWAKASFEKRNPSGNETSLVGITTMGFVMFGDPDERFGDPRYDGRNTKFKFWNYDYAYNETYILAPNPQRRTRYNYDVNFNGDHQGSRYDWPCGKCFDMAPDFNSGDDARFYTGISMEPEEDGWWKYTLTGVAQPGRTMIIFANWHEPWADENLLYDYRPEDYRWPGDYEAGLPLFDFEDNDGWFLFDGNTLNSDQKFTDNKPNNIIPHDFNGVYSGPLKIEVENPKKVRFTKIQVGYQDNVRLTSEDQYKDRWGYDNDYHDLKTYAADIIDTNSEINYFTIDHPVIPDNYEHLVVRLYTSDSSYREYKLAPKYFTMRGGEVVTVHPLMLEYKEGIKLYVKWNDQVEPQGYWGEGDKPKASLLTYYKPPKPNGSTYLNVYWGTGVNWSNNNKMRSYEFKDREIGNYKYITFPVEEVPSSNNDKLRLRLCTTEAGDNNFYKVLKVEDLPQYYYPAQDNYLINWHLLPNP